MSYSVQQLMVEVGGTGDDYVAVLHTLSKSGIVDAVDLGLLDEDDISSLAAASNGSDARGILIKLKNAARSILAGWTSGKLVCCSKQDVPAVARSPRVALAPSAPRGMTVTRRQTVQSVSAFATRCLLGRRPQSSTRIKTVKTILEKETDVIDRSLKHIHGIFEKFATESPRMTYLISMGTSAELDMQLDIYKMKSRSATVIRRRGAQLEAFFLEIQSFGWNCGSLMPFQVGTWVRSRCKDAPPTATVLARSLLNLVQASTEWVMHINDPIVVAQLAGAAKSNTHTEAPKKAIQLPIEVVKVLESLVTLGVTPQQRCLSGFMALLAASSARASDCAEDDQPGDQGFCPNG